PAGQARFAVPHRPDAGFDPDPESLQVLAELGRTLLGEVHRNVIRPLRPGSDAGQASRLIRLDPGRSAEADGYSRAGTADGKDRLVAGARIQRLQAVRSAGVYVQLPHAGFDHLP